MHCCFDATCRYIAMPWSTERRKIETFPFVDINSNEFCTQCLELHSNDNKSNSISLCHFHFWQIFKKYKNISKNHFLFPQSSFSPYHQKLQIEYIGILMCIWIKFKHSAFGNRHKNCHSSFIDHRFGHERLIAYSS